MSDKALGLKLPLTYSSTSFFAQNFTTIDQAKTNLINLLLTNKGERIMLPDFGVGLYNYVFDPIDTDMISQIKDDIINNVEKWLPYIVIRNLTILPDIDNLKVSISISFSIKNDPNRLESIQLALSFN